MVHFVALRLAAFKSFVDPTELRIEPGLTGVVGPNGCGKSNLVEALRWVMGEGSAKAMRGGEMEDVIFSGTANRSARAAAEVTVELATGGASLPMPWQTLDQLDVSRRIERAKGSTYRVNGREVRARDVHLLFADAATGAKSTAIVSQGQIGALIAARPRERRMILEEAAGITGLYARRHEAELRLNSAATNLERVDDLLLTVEAQLKNLRRQSRQAERFRTLSDDIQTTETILLLRLWREARARLAAFKVDVATRRTELSQRTDAAMTEDEHLQACAACLPELREAHGAAAAEVQRLSLALAASEAEERRAIADRDAARARVDQVASDLPREAALFEEAKQSLERLGAEETRVRARAEGEGEARQAAEAALTEASAAVDTADAELAALTAMAAAAETERRALVSKREEIEGRRVRLRQRLSEVERQRTELAKQAISEAELAQAVAAAATADTEAEQARSAADRADAALRKFNDVANTAHADHQALAADLARCSAEADALDQLLREPAERGAGGNGCPPLADAVTSEPGWEAALAAALGDDLLAAVEDAADAHAGDGNADPRWRTVPTGDTEPALPSTVKPMASVVSGPPAFARRLAQVGILETPEAAAQVQEMLRPGQRIVTADGGLWRWDGFVATASSSGAAAAARLRQRNRLTALIIERQHLEAKASAAASRNEEASAAAETARHAERAAREVVKAADTVARTAAGAARDAETRFASLTMRREQLVQSADTLAQDLAEADDAWAAVSAQLGAAPDPQANSQALEALRTTLANRRQDQAERRRHLETLDREASGRAARLRTIQADLRSWRERRAKAQTRRDSLNQRLRDCEAEKTVLEDRPGQVAAERHNLQTTLAAAEANLGAAEERLQHAEAARDDAERQAKAAERSLADAREAAARAEAGRDQAMAALTAAEQRIRSALTVPAEALEAEMADRLDQMTDTPEALEQRLEKLRRDRDMLGPVNLCADAEAAEMAAHIDMLKRERGDLDQAIVKLRQGIAELNREGRERLRQSFDAVDQHFQTLFRRLFDGGRAHLALTDADDPLEAGLEIMASPPGKRTQALSLLSGGEQALATLALIFAVFLANPAPVCVLDEVDAPLDDANVDRFCSLLEDMAASSGTRFLVITHHRMTMARMDRLFGVTMAERGVSSLVSVDLRHAEALRNTA